MNHATPLPPGVTLPLMGVRWKLKEFLTKNEVSAYALAVKVNSKLSQKGVYRLTDDDLSGIRFNSLDVIIPALNELTGKRLQVSDLLEFEYDDEAN